MNAARAVQIEIVQADFQQALDAFAADRFDIAVKHGQDGLQKLIDFKNAEEGVHPPKQLTIDIDPKP